MTKGRDFVLLASCFILASSSFATEELVFVGVYNSSIGFPGCGVPAPPLVPRDPYQEDSIFVYTFDEEGKMELINKAKAGLNPSWIVKHPKSVK
jgi:hypothetical protein